MAATVAAAATRPILYYALFSPPSRACLLTSKLIGLDLDLKEINFAAKENHSEWYLKLNPRHTVPVLVDQGIPICESHSIITYMVDQYGQQHESLYPKDLLRRAIVDERLYYENGVFFRVIHDFATRILRGNEMKYDSKIIEEGHKAYAFLELILSQNSYMAGNKLTLADISINTTALTLHKIVDVEKKRYPRLTYWLERMRQELPDYEEINAKGAQLLYERFQESIENNMMKRVT